MARHCCREARAAGRKVDLIRYGVSLEAIVELSRDNGWSEVVDVLCTWWSWFLVSWNPELDDWLLLSV